jgi:succinate dehydrogenase / fumarate reductase, iron-sulfur subunit
MNVTLRVWRQKSRATKGEFGTYQVRDISPDTSFLEMLDILNEELTGRGDDPIAFDHDCREGICGACGLVINGIPHGQRRGKVTTCQLHMRSFRNGATITIEPWRVTAFPVLKDLVVDRSAFDRVIQAGGFISVSAGGAPDAHDIVVQKWHADMAMTAAACVGCGACAAVCPNACAILFVAAKAGHLSYLPQGQPERLDRAIKLTRAMDREGFGACTNIGECTAVCPKGIACSDYVSRLNKDYIKARLLKGRLSTEEA